MGKEVSPNTEWHKRPVDAPTGPKAKKRKLTNVVEVS
jgi:hypothetical protein